MPRDGEGAPRPEQWAELPDEQLLDLRMCDLPLALPGGIMQGRIAELQAELETRELRVPIHFYLAEEWFTPDGAAAIAVPFYLAHPRLEKLERAQMLEVEGGDTSGACASCATRPATSSTTPTSCGCGASASALFGTRRSRTRSSTRPSPTARASCMHLDPWYAQSHPDEDFAETFAVWLTPGVDWPRALRRLAGGKKLVTSTR